MYFPAVFSLSCGRGVVGVGHLFPILILRFSSALILPVSIRRSNIFLEPSFPHPIAAGVGHLLCNAIPLSVCTFLPWLFCHVLRPASGVGKHPKPFPPMVRANLFRRDAIPFRIEPRFGQLPENNSGVWFGKETWHILQQRKARSYLPKDADDGRPSVARVGFREAFACDAERLAREPRSDNIHASTPGSPVERERVVPDRRVVEPPISNARLEDLDRIRFPFNVAHGSPSEQPLTGEQSPACPGK